MIVVGTAGFSYADWRGRFYPEGLKPGDLLAYYASQFKVVELDFSYYRMPTLNTMKGLERKTPPGFEFCVKAYKGMTHERAESAGDQRAVFGQFLESLAPIQDAGKLACVLVQFPWSFKFGPEGMDYLEFVRDNLAGTRVVVEFRNRDWLVPEAFERLRSLDMAFCCVDEPRLRGLLPPVAQATSSFGYVRFHGRNAAKWWSHEQPWERYDYLYSPAELEEWVPKLRKLEAECGGTGSTVYVLFNNCHAGQAAQNARQMQAMLDLL